MGLPQIGPKETPQPTTAPVMEVSNDQPFVAKPFAPLLGFLELPAPDNKSQTQLQEIWDYLGKESKSELISERLHTLRNLEGRLSPPRLGQSRLVKIHQYIQAQRQVEQAEKWRDGHLKGINID